jgi:hypothetical protein
LAIVLWQWPNNYLDGGLCDGKNEMKMLAFTAEASLCETSGHYKSIARPAGLSGEQAVIPQSNCSTYAEMAVQYWHLASKASAQGDFGLTLQFLQEYQSWAGLYQDCEAAHIR